jgi:glycerophosphoryl diester phosphodiesterase
LRFYRRFILSGTLAFVAIGVLYAFEFLHSAPPKFPIREPILIAHGGYIDGKAYTNSVEALLESVKRGYRFIEIDLLKTSDGILFGAHDWESFNRITGGEVGAALTSFEIRDRKIYEKYSVLFPETINKVFTENPSLILVTDKIEDFDAILNQIHFPNMQERLLVEVFSYQKYKEALKKGIKYPMLNRAGLDSLKSRLPYIKNGRIAIITVGFSEADRDKAELLETIVNSGAQVFAYTSNDLFFIKTHIGERVSGFYTDTIEPADLR